MTAAFDVDVVVAGAGPAGSAAALALARRGARVQLCEAGSLPRHRLCGEFVSPEAASDLTALGLDLDTIGAVRLDTARVACGNQMVRTTLCGFAVPRYRLDEWLARAAVASGATLALETAVDSISGDAAQGFTVTLARSGGRTESMRARFVVGAFGRRAMRLRRDDEPAPDASRGRVGLKTHFDGIAASNEVELHAVRGGYVGVAPVGPGRVNVCAVLQRDLVRTSTGGAQAVLSRAIAGAPALAERLAAGREDATARCAASGLRFGGSVAAWRSVLLVGDAVAMPHPFAGNGIAMAIRAGRMAAEHIDDGLAGRIAATAVESAYARAWRREFASRLAWDAPLHALLERPFWARSLVRTLGVWPHGVEWLVTRTRGTAVPVTGRQEARG